MVAERYMDALSASNDVTSIWVIDGCEATELPRHKEVSSLDGGWEHIKTYRRVEGSPGGIRERRVRVTQVV